MLAGRRIVLGVTGGVAAYKAAYLARRLVEHGAHVRTVMTESATEFLGPATLAAITGTQPVISLFGNPEVSPHTDMARWADLIIVAPVTAASLSRYASGESSDAVSATLLASTAPVLLAPAMHSEMWENQATQANIDAVVARGYAVIEPDVGDLAGGDVGVGRLREPDDILQVIAQTLHSGPLAGVNVLVTAGGTKEPIDPVRYIGNRSSGKMGAALAREAAARGATVTLVTTAGDPDISGVNAIDVESANEMAEAAWAAAPKCDIAVMAAAVADFMPNTSADTKIKRADGTPTIQLVATPDVLAGVNNASPRPFLVGFAAETGSLDDAVSKAVRKGVDLLIANDVAKPGSGFGSDTNEVAIIDASGIVAELPLMTKDEVASAIWDEVIARRGRG